MYEIKKNIPIPLIPHIYPFSDMEIGDCFEIICDNQKEARLKRNNVSSPVRSYIKKHNKDFKIATRIFKRDNKYIIGIWRIS